MQDLDLKTELSENDWIEDESLRLLTQSRSRMTWFAAGTMVAMAAQLFGHVNVFLLAVWLMVSLVVVVFRVYIKSEFNKHFSNAEIGVKCAFINRNQLAWTLNAFTWGVSGWLFFTSIPIDNQYIGATILTFVGLVAVHNLNTHREISTQFINILMGTQVLGAVWYIAYEWRFQGPQLQYIHLLSLVVIWAVLHSFNNRLFNAFKRNMSLQFRNNSLIRTLNLKTEQLAHEKQVAMNANEVIQRFYSSSAHDIRQPVYALKMYAELAATDNAQLPALLPKITASCDAINNLFDSLFDFEQINSGHVNVAHQTVDIDELIDDLEHQFKPLARRKKLEFRTNTVSGYLQTDQLLVKRILTCFISNAVKYTEKGGILITVRKRRSMVVFEVWDTGIGIDAAHLEHVFEEFYKVGDFSSTDEGFGLGLSVVKSLSGYAEGSKISVNSRIGVGSVFRFAMPLKIYTPPYIKSRFENLKTLPLVLDHDIS
ncbi:MAG: HAMP domain-containing sensor histidine kinase [Burkholderiaceae bacterium]